jgi:3-keto-5-aminohexanoate cleavage enzyme
MPAPMPVLIMAALNGARRTKADHPRLPLSADEIAHDALACRDAGAAAVHVHARDSAGQHVLDGQIYAAISARLAAVAGPELLLQATTEAAGRYGVDAQIAMVRDLRPHAVSVALREILPADAGREAMVRAADFFAWMKQAGIWAQFIAYDAADVRRAVELSGRGVLGFARPFLLFVLGRYAKDQISTPEDLQPFLDALGGADLDWMMCAFGPHEHDCARTVIAAGGHVRVGFENNLHLPSGAIAPDNAALVALAAQAARESGRGIMGADALDGLRARTMI